MFFYTSTIVVQKLVKGTIGHVFEIDIVMAKDETKPKGKQLYIKHNT